MKRNLYIMSFNKFGWDKYDSFLVSAKDEIECEATVKERYNVGSSMVEWSEGFEIEKVGETNKPKGIIMESFNAG